MKKILATLFVLAPLTLAACGGGSGSSSSASSSSKGGESSSGGTSSAAPVDKVDIEFWTPFGQTPLEATTKKAKEFADIIKKQTGVTVNIDVSYQGGYDDIRSKISQGFATANVPTMAVAYPDHVATYLGQATNNVYEISKFFSDKEVGFGKQKYLGDSAEYGEDDILESYLDEGRHYGIEGTYSYPLMKSSEVMFYNKDAVDKIIQMMPDTFLPSASRTSAEAFLDSLSWDDLVSVAQYALDNKAKILDTLESPIWYDSDANLFISKMYQKRIDFTSIDAQGHGKLEFETGAARNLTEDMVNSLADAAKKGLLTTKGVKGTYGSTAFGEGKCIFEIGSSGGAGYNEPSGAAFNYGVTMVPASNKNPLYVSQGPDIAFIRNPGVTDEVNALRVKYAWQFAKFLTNPTHNVYLCTYGSEGYVPVRYSAYETEEYQQFLREGELIAETSRVLTNKIDGKFLVTDVFIGSAELREQAGGILTQVFTGAKDTKTAIDEAIDYVKTYMK